MRNILCLLGIHDFERVSEPVPARSDSEFNFLVEFYALGKCRRCPKFAMVRCWGGEKPYHGSDVKTKEEWLEILRLVYEGRGKCVQFLDYLTSSCSIPAMGGCKNRG